METKPFNIAVKLLRWRPHLSRFRSGSRILRTPGKSSYLRFIAHLFLLILSFTFLSTAKAAWPGLNKEDMQRFGQTFPDIYKGCTALGLNVNPQTGEVDGSDLLMWNKEAQRVLNHNGWCSGTPRQLTRRKISWIEIPLPGLRYT